MCTLADIEVRREMFVTFYRHDITCQITKNKSRSFRRIAPFTCAKSLRREKKHFSSCFAYIDRPRQSFESVETSS